MSPTFPVRSPAQIPRGDGSDGSFNPDEWMEPKEQRKVDDYILYAISAATQALADAGWAPKTDEEQIATGVLIGSGIGGLGGIYDASITLRDRGPRRISPFFIPGRLINLASGYVSIQHRLRGPNHAVVTACSTGAHAIGDAGADDCARRCRRHGGGRCRIGGQSHRTGRLCRVPRLVDRFQRPPRTAPRVPMIGIATASSWARGRAASCSRNIEHAKARGAKIYAELVGYGMSGDAYHITAPAADGDGAFRCMKMAITRAELSPR